MATFLAVVMAFCAGYNLTTDEYGGLVFMKGGTLSTATETKHEPMAPTAVPMKCSLDDRRPAICHRTKRNTV